MECISLIHLKYLAIICKICILEEGSLRSHLSFQLYGRTHGYILHTHQPLSPSHGRQDSWQWRRDSMGEALLHCFSLLDRKHTLASIWWVAWPLHEQKTWQLVNPQHRPAGWRWAPSPSPQWSPGASLKMEVERDGGARMSKPSRASVPCSETELKVDGVCFFFFFVEGKSPSPWCLRRRRCWSQSSGIRRRAVTCQPVTGKSPYTGTHIKHLLWQEL